MAALQIFPFHLKLFHVYLSSSTTLFSFTFWKVFVASRVESVVLCSAGSTGKVGQNRLTVSGANNSFLQFHLLHSFFREILCTIVSHRVDSGVFDCDRQVLIRSFLLAPFVASFTKSFKLLWISWFQSFFKSWNAWNFCGSWVERGIWSNNYLFLSLYWT